MNCMFINTDFIIIPTEYIYFWDTLYTVWENSWWVISELPRWKDGASDAAGFRGPQGLGRSPGKALSSIVLVLSRLFFSLLTVPNHVFFKIPCKSKCEDPPC